MIEKLAALVPPRWLNLVRYHGLLAPNAADRARIVPGPKAEHCQAPAAAETELTPAQRRHRLAWSDLLRRVFRVEVTVCPACGGRMKIVAALTEPRSIRRYLEGVGLPSRAPPVAPARPHPQHEIETQPAASAAAIVRRWSTGGDASREARTSICYGTSASRAAP